MIEAMTEAGLAMGKIKTDQIEKIDLPCDLLFDVCRRTCEVHEPLAIYVFGSYARGDHHEDSDLDLFILLEDMPFKALEETSSSIGMSLFSLPISKDVVYQTAGRFAERCSRYSTCEAQVAREGVLIYG